MACQFDFSKANWIWSPNYDDTIDPGQFVLFRKTIWLESSPNSPCLVRISADTRYRFFVNGKRASFGPCKSYPAHWYYETVDILPFLKKGKNVVAAKVLRFSPIHAGNSSMMRGPVPGFFVHGEHDGVELHTDSSWRCKVDESVQIIPRSEWDYSMGPPFMSLNERVDQNLAEHGWEYTEFNDDHWSFAIIKSASYKMMPILHPLKLVERPIPQLPEKPKRFRRAVKVDGIVPISSWNQMLIDEEAITIPANISLSVDIETDVLTTGFLQLQYEARSSSNILIIAAECYEKSMKSFASGDVGISRSKGDRTDHENGALIGPIDDLTTSVGDAIYQPFWFHTFRYVQLRIKTTDSPLVLRSFTFRETHYPLEIRTHFRLRKNSLYENIWSLSLNTLRNCMHETYEDCPFYEQNQFAMDSRLMILFTYQLSRDDALARKTIHEFHSSRRDDNLIETHFPVPFRTINIPTFSLHWILMLYDHMLYFRDASFLRQYLGTVDGILHHFSCLLTPDRRLIGRFADTETWAFVDWVPEWHNLSGGLQTLAVPPAYHLAEGELAYVSLFFSFALQAAADLFAFVSRHDMEREYRGRARELNAAVNTHCFDNTRGLYTDGPTAVTSDTSQHTQIFAVLAGASVGNNASRLMWRMLAETAMVRCSYAHSFYLNRALAMSHIYSPNFPSLIRPWETMLLHNLTTCPEDPGVMSRSDCHGWSCAPIYEAVAEIWGVYPRGIFEEGEKITEREYGLEWIIQPRLELLWRYFSDNTEDVNSGSPASTAVQTTAEGTFAISGGTMNIRIYWHHGDWWKATLRLTASTDIAVQVHVPLGLHDAAEFINLGTEQTLDESLNYKKRVMYEIRLKGNAEPVILTL